MQNTQDQAEAIDPALSRAVGARLRAIRRQQGLSLEEVEERSSGKWSASAIGAYERGDRNLSVPRLVDLARFYQVPVWSLLEDRPIEATSGGLDADDVIDLTEPIMFDLHALDQEPGAQLIDRFCRSIVTDRQDYNGRVLSVRRADLRTLAVLHSQSMPAFVEQLHKWNVLTERGGALAPVGTSSKTTNGGGAAQGS